MTSLHPFLLEELKALQAEGVRGLYIGDDTWRALQERPLRVSPSVMESERNSPQVDKSNFGNAVDLLPAKSEVARPRVVLPSEVTLKTVNLGPPKTVLPKASLPPAPVVSLPGGDKVAQLAYLKELVLNCSVCKANTKPGKKIVFGVGSPDADIFFCGEAPGAEEETQGEPFVGPAGQLLTRIIQAMGLSREKVYIANILNWRPDMPTPFGNRPPTHEEMAFGLPYLKAQLDIVRPKVIVALGATATAGLLGVDPKRKMGEARGQWYNFGEYPVIVTYHPSYLLRNATQKTKRQVWEDMLSVMERLQMPISEKQRGFFT